MNPIQKMLHNYQQLVEKDDYKTEKALQLRKELEHIGCTTNDWEVYNEILHKLEMLDMVINKRKAIEQTRGEQS